MINDEMSAVDALIKNWPWAIGVIAFLGGTIASLLRDLLNNFFSSKVQDSEHLQQRTLFHIDYLKETANRIEARLDQIIYANNFGLGVVVATEARPAEEQVGTLVDVASVSLELSRVQNLNELAYLKSLANQYNLGSDFLENIEKLKSELNTLKDISDDNVTSHHLKKSGIILMEIQTLLRIATHLLIDKLTK